MRPCQPFGDQRVTATGVRIAMRPDILSRCGDPDRLRGGVAEHWGRAGFGPLDGSQGLVGKVRVLGKLVEGGGKVNLPDSASVAIRINI